MELQQAMEYRKRKHARRNLYALYSHLSLSRRPFDPRQRWNEPLRALAGGAEIFWRFDFKIRFPAFNRDSCKNAPVLVVCAMVSHRSGFERSGEATNELGDGWGCYDCGLAHMNLLLKATELGLSTLVMGIRDADALRRRLEIPDDQTVLGVIAIGYSDLAPDMPPRRSPEETIRYF